MFPDPDGKPPGSLQQVVRITVALHVPTELRPPVLDVGGRLAAMFGTPVPEAPVNEHGDLCRAKDDVCASTDLPKGPIVNAVSETGLVQEPPDG